MLHSRTQMDSVPCLVRRLPLAFVACDLPFETILLKNPVVLRRANRDGIRRQIGSSYSARGMAHPCVPKGNGRDVAVLRHT